MRRWLGVVLEDHRYSGREGVKYELMKRAMTPHLAGAMVEHTEISSPQGRGLRCIYDHDFRDGEGLMHTRS